MDPKPVIRARLAYGDGWITWCEHRGRYWRPLVVDGPRLAHYSYGRRVSPPDELWRNGFKFLHEWRDYPLPGWSRVGGRSPHEPLAGEPVWDDREQAIARARQLSRGLIDVDGIILRPAPLPAWTVRDLTLTDPSTTRVELVLPDHHDDMLHGDDGGLPVRPSLGLFPAHALDHALDVSRQLFGEVAIHTCKATGIKGRAVREAHPPDKQDIRVLGPVDTAATVADGLLRLHRRLRPAMEGLDPWEVGDGFADAMRRVDDLADLVRASGRRPAAELLDGLCGAAEDAWRIAARETRRDTEWLLPLRVAALMSGRRLERESDPEPEEAQPGRHF